MSKLLKRGSYLLLPLVAVCLLLLILGLFPTRDREGEGKVEFLPVTAWRQWSIGKQKTQIRFNLGTQGHLTEDTGERINVGFIRYTFTYKEFVQKP